MTETIQLGEMSIAVTRKDIKNVHLSVHPPDGRVTMAAPAATRLDVVRAYAISKLGWIREPAAKLADAGAGNAPAVHRAGEPLPVGPALPADGREEDAKPVVALDHKRITSDRAPRQQCGQARGGHARVAQGLARLRQSRQLKPAHRRTVAVSGGLRNPGARLPYPNPPHHRFPSVRQNGFLSRS